MENVSGHYQMSPGRGQTTSTENHCLEVSSLLALHDHGVRGQTYISQVWHHCWLTVCFSCLVMHKIVVYLLMDKILGSEE